MLKILKTVFCILAFSIFSDAQTQTQNKGIYYEIKGTRGPWIVFSHGGFGDRRMWDLQIEEFTKHYRMLRYDHRGFGKSGPPEKEYSPVKDVLDLLDELKIDRAHIVGNSMGGTLAIDFTLLHPSRVASLTVVASGPSGIPVPQEDLDYANAVFKTADEKGTKAAAEMVINNPMVAVTSRLPSTAPLLKTMIYENASIYKMKFWPFEKMDPPASKRLSEIRVPTLIILGEKDEKAVNQIGEIAATGIKGAKKEVIPGADHLPQMVSPAKFNRILADFLKNVESNSKQ